MKNANDITLLSLGPFTPMDVAAHDRYSRYFNDLVMYNTGGFITAPTGWRSYHARPSFDLERILKDIRPLLRTKYVFVLFAQERLLNDEALSALTEPSKKQIKGFLVPIKYKSRNEIYWEPRIHKSDLRSTGSFYLDVDGTAEYSQLVCPIDSPNIDLFSIEAMNKVRAETISSTQMSTFDLRCYARDSLLEGNLEESIGATLQALGAWDDLTVYQRIGFLNMLLVCADQNEIRDLAIQKCLRYESVISQSSTALCHLIKFLRCKRGALVDDELETLISKFTKKLTFVGETNWNDCHSIGLGKTIKNQKFLKEELCTA